ncbi:hypothetical protein QQX98_006600 [Neonectria punicea]|uniref:Uncharacterized protein n=1 Tax=Neonectria punicea TaxID=979145 RepID=A0ABR1H119_9HYPO
MANQLSSLIFIMSLNFAAALANYTEPVEQLFLDIPLNDLLYNTSIIPLVEPWASSYVDSLRNQRFGDAVWARYQMEGDVENGIIEDSSMAVLDSIGLLSNMYKGKTQGRPLPRFNRFDVSYRLRGGATD